MPLPFITIQIDNEMYGLPLKGSLVYQYNPFYNLQNPIPSDNESALKGLRINSKQAEIDITVPITLEVEPSYDDSVNLIIADNANPAKIVNSRFYQTSTMTYEIADRKGNLDTNIYSENNFKTEAGLIKVVRSVVGVDFLGISDGGNVKVGNYNFYFKLADADGNESDFIAESGKVVCHIGTVNTPSSIRGGQLNENSHKVIKFRLKNLDLAYDYIKVYYSRSTGDHSQEVTQTFRIIDKYKITNDEVEISITGYEEHEEITVEDINLRFAQFDAEKSIANCQNMTFVGNTTNQYELFKVLEKYSLYITPQVAYDPIGIGNLDHNYIETSPDIGNEYYNANNIYYKLGYWDEEIYRFGIVYILNNYTLSPVFNIRGKKILDLTTNFIDFRLADTINFGEDHIIEGSDFDNPENTKGVFKIDTTVKNMFNGSDSIKPIGIKFNFTNDVIIGDGKFLDGLQDITKGFFIVRQKRIPTILAQSVGIGTSSLAKIPVIQATKPSYFSYSYIAEGFTTLDSNNEHIKLGAHLIEIDSEKVNNNALLCPEATLNREMFNTLFNSSEYLLKDFKYNTSSKVFNQYGSINKFAFKNLLPSNTTDTINSELILIEPGIELISSGQHEFSSQLGDEFTAYKFGDVELGDYTDPLNQNAASSPNAWNETDSKVRGIFNTYIGCSSNNIVHGKYYNIFQKDYNMAHWKNYFLIRYNDSSPYFPVSDRLQWKNLTLTSNHDIYGKTYTSEPCFRGDCYINTYTHRMHWNFIDPEAPTNKLILDPYTWAKNIKILEKASTTFNSDISGSFAPTSVSYFKLLKLFTYKHLEEPDTWKDDGTSVVMNPDYEPPTGLLEPDAKRFKKYSERNGIFGAEKVNRPDVNAVPLGHWVTFKICSNTNLAMRDIDFSRPSEEAVHRRKRGFYPLYAMDPKNHLPESDIINAGISKSLSNKYYFELPNVPFIKTNFSTRIHYSNILQNSAFTNGNRVFEAQNHVDYSREYGALVKLIEWYGKLVAVMEHGVLMIPVNERAMMTNASGENVYLNTTTVLPKNPMVLSNTFGSIWPESVIKTSRYIYGIDTVAKKIWRTNGELLETISDLKIQKFLNDNINLRESDKDRTIGINFVKSHYNAFKYDVIFVFKYGNKKWNLCWNELLGKWTTQYTWFPEFSENINNIFYTFANNSIHPISQNKLYKHGFAGTFEETGEILPTNWYEEQHPFEFEFVVTKAPGVQKIFNNLMLISNAVEPDSFYYECKGDGLNWANLKSLIIKLNDTTLNTIDGISMVGISQDKTETNVQLRYKRYLSSMQSIKKIPYIFTSSIDVNVDNNFYDDREAVNEPFGIEKLRDLNIYQEAKTKEQSIISYQKGADIKKYNRRKGNMQYLEDSWDVQIQPISISYAYLNKDTLMISPPQEMKIRDNYLKIRVKYTGTQYAIINALKTLFTISYA